MTFQDEHASVRPAILVIPSAADRCMRGMPPVIRDDGTIEIPLTKGMRALVSPDSYGLVRDHLWHADRNTDRRTYYARSDRAGQPRMHRVVVGSPRGLEVDHENQDGLDNRTGNLRVATRRENARNARIRNGWHSRFKGVTWFRRDAKWHAQITCDGKVNHLGYFDDEEAAARAYDEAAKRLFGKFAATNEDAGLLPRRDGGLPEPLSEAGLSAAVAKVGELLAQRATTAPRRWRELGWRGLSDHAEGHRAEVAEDPNHIDAETGHLAQTHLVARELMRLALLLDPPI